MNKSINLLLDFAENKGLEVEFPDFKSKTGFIFGNVIAISNKNDPEEKEITLAHELAHFYLHKDKHIQLDDPLIEEQADRAANMLLDFMKLVQTRKYSPKPTKANRLYLKQTM